MKYEFVQYVESRYSHIKQVKHNKYCITKLCKTI